MEALEVFTNIIINHIDEIYNVMKLCATVV